MKKFLHNLYVSSFSKLKEQYLGYVFGMISFIISYRIFYSTESLQSLFKDIAQISMVLFGFLMTVLSLFLQGNGAFYSEIKRKTEIYKRYIAMNKRVVYLSFIIAVFSLIIGNISCEYMKDIITSKTIFVLINRGVVSLYFALVAKLVVDTYYFIDIFYVLISKDNQQD